MTVNTIKIVGQVLPPTGVPDTRSRVFFVMTGYDTDADDDAVIYPVPGRDDEDGFPIASDGTIDVDLWPNQEGERNTMYRVEVQVHQLNRPVRVPIASISVPNTGGPYNLNDLLGVEPPPDATVEEYIAQLAAAAAAAEAAAQLARKFAENPEDVEVDPTGYPDEYSARHYSKKSEESAISAADSVVQARTAAARVLPAEVTGDFWRHVPVGKPGNGGMASWVIENDGYVTIPASDTKNTHFLSQAALPWIEGRVYRITPIFRTASPVVGVLSVYLAGLKTDYTSSGWFTLRGGFSTTTGNEWRTQSIEYTLPAQPADTAQFRIGVMSNEGAKPDIDIDLRAILVEDVTSEKAAAAAASREYIARSDLEAFVAGGGPIEQGRRYVADGVNYRGSAGATVLPALPGLLKMSKDCYLMEQFGSFSEGDDVSDVLGYCLEAAFADRASRVELAPGEFFLASRVMAEWAANGPNAHVVDIQGAGCVLTLPPSNTDGGIRIATANNFQHLRIHDLLLLSSAPIGTIASATNGIALEVYSNLRPGDPGWGVTSGRQLEMNNVRAVSNNPGPNGRWDGGVYVDGFWFPLFNNVYVDTRWKNNGETTAEYEIGDGVRVMNSYSPELIGCQSLGAFTHNIRIDEDADMPYEDFQITSVYAVGGKDALTVKMSTPALVAAALKEPGGRVSGGHFNGHRHAINIENRRQFTIEGALLYTTIGTGNYNYADASFIRLHNCHDGVVAGNNIPEGGHFVNNGNCTRHVLLSGDTSNTLVTNNLFGANGIAVASSSTGARNKIENNKYGGSPAPGTTGPSVNILDAHGTLTGSDVVQSTEPTLEFGGANVGMTFTRQDGGFTRSGRVVTGWFDIKLSAKGSSTGNANVVIPGLPAPVAGSDHGLVFSYTASTTNAPRGAIINGIGQIELFTWSASGGMSTRITDTSFGNITELRGSFSYLSEDLA